MKSSRSKSFNVVSETIELESVNDKDKVDIPSGEVDDGSGRGQFSGLEFLMSCISVAVGLGNVWRFPYVAYQNGGGAFLLPYLILLFIIGRPLYYLELLMGQFGGKGPIKVWKILPAFKGVGYAQFVCNFYIVIFYNYLMALALFYMFASFNSPLPWTECNSEWANCTIETEFANGSLIEFKQDAISHSEAYFYRHVVHKSKSLSEVNYISFKLIGCMMFSWTIIYFSISRGVKSVGKVAYFTASFPYIVLISLLIAALMNEGAVDGLIYVFKPQWHKLLDLKAGMYMITLLQNSVGSTFFFYAIIELSGFIWIYGLNRACSNFQFMLKREVGLYWKITWAFATPLLITVICIYATYDTFLTSNTADTGIPPWGYAIVAALAAVPLGQLPYWAMKAICAKSGSLKQRIRKAFSPHPTWGPSKEADFELWKMYDESKSSSPSTFTQSTAL